MTGVIYDCVTEFTVEKRLIDKTKAHYDTYPFIMGGANRIAWWQDYLHDFLPDEDIRDKLIADVGSGAGEISRGLLDRGARLACLDLSLKSLQKCRQVNPEARIFHANALELPFPDDTFDHAISIGVLHHTPDCRKGFREVSRITAPGGTIVLFLYNFWNIYNVIYHAFKPIRAIVPLNRIPFWIVRMLQPFAKSHLQQNLDDEQLRNLLGDKLWTPQATFHSVSQVRRWGMEEGLTFLATKKFFLGYANVMRFVKKDQPGVSGRREIALMCIKCGNAPMQKKDSGYVCGRCGHEYGVDKDIVACTND